MEEKRIVFGSETLAEIIIKARLDSGKQRLLLLWIILWSLAGLGLLSQFFIAGNEDMKGYLAVWMAFWIYFEFKAFSAWRWRKHGYERIQVEDHLFKVSAGLPGRHQVRHFDSGKMGKMKLHKVKSTAIGSSMNSAYWNRGNPCIAFEYEDEEVCFGLELSDDEAKQVMAYITRALKKVH